LDDKIGERRSPEQMEGFITDVRAVANRYDFDLNQ
jgi:hypothetical protein